MSRQIVSRLVLPMIVTGVFGTRSAATQELPREVIVVALRQVVRADTAGMTIATHAFPSPENARAAARQVGMRVGNRKADLVQCEDDQRTCRIPGGGKVVSLVGFEALADQVKLQIVISTPVLLPDGTARVFAEQREITVTRIDGKWTLTTDRLLFRG